MTAPKTFPKTYHVKSFGCQMNVYDGERMAELMAAWGPAHVDPSVLVEDEVTIAVQHKGKLRDTLTAAKGASKEDLEAMALASEKVQRSLDGAEIRKVIVVPDRLVNIVT